MFYQTKSKPNTSIDGKIAENIYVKGNTLYIINETDTITYKDGWFINGVYQGEEASYIYTIAETQIVDRSILFNVFENIKQGE